MNRERLWTWQHRYAPYAFIAPFVLLFCIFMLYPLGLSVVLSLYKYVNANVKQFVGLGHYAFFLRDRLFWMAVLNTVIYTAAVVGLQIPASLGLALLLNNKRVRGRNTFRFAFFSSHLVGNVFVAVIFMLLMAQRHGLIPKFLGMFSPALREINWLGDPINARMAVILAILWLSVGWGMIYFLAALQAVEKELYEAAEVDGAGKWAQFWHVTLPGIRPVLIFMIVVGTIGSFQLFELPYIIFQGAGPSWAGLTIVMYLWQNGFELGDIGAASAVGWLLVALILGVSLMQLKISRATKEE
jgi:ABC-type sugar transport system permease subunit